MSTNDPWKSNGYNTYQGSVNQGLYEAKNCHFASVQQPGESHFSYTTRMGAFQAEKNRNKS
jgi:hypothetical protein